MCIAFPANMYYVLCLVVMGKGVHAVTEAVWFEKLA